MTAFADIAAAYQQRLLAAPQIVGDRVYRGRVRPLKAGQSDGLVVRMVRTTARLAGVGLSAPKDWDTVLGIEVLARGDTPDAAEDAVDALLGLVYARLAGWAPAGLSVLDALSEPAVVWDVDEGDTAVARATVVVNLNHRTQASALVPHS
jgi:hypothetical protein